MRTEKELLDLRNRYYRVRGQAPCGAVAAYYSDILEILDWTLGLVEFEDGEPGLAAARKVREKQEIPTYEEIKEERRRDQIE